MVKDQDTPYLSIVGHVLAAASDDQEVYISGWPLLSLMGIKSGNMVSALMISDVMEC